MQRHYETLKYLVEEATGRETKSKGLSPRYQQRMYCILDALRNDLLKESPARADRVIGRFACFDPNSPVESRRVGARPSEFSPSAAKP